MFMMRTCTEPISALILLVGRRYSQLVAVEIKLRYVDNLSRQGKYAIPRGVGLSA